MTKRAYFIIATDTGVGKTFIACGLAKAFRSMGLSVGVMKPFESGCGVRNGALVPADALALIKAASSTDPLDLVNPYRFRAALAPNIAARLERKKINLEKIKKAFKMIADGYDVTLVEGAGGILSPITNAMSNADLALLMGLPVIIVVPSRLGAINQALLAIEAARTRGLEVSAVVLNRLPQMGHRGSDNSLRYNRGEIKHIGGVEVVEVG
ncbi:MAG: dethiobiotin synthase [Deltaproteobacteria bacterium]|nr:dethiobiotin synthase [Deltaproteobacteria bacterium]